MIVPPEKYDLGTSGLKNIIARLPERLLPAKRRPKSVTQQRKTAKSSKGGFPPLDTHSEPEEGEYQGTDSAVAAGSASKEAPRSDVDPGTEGMARIGERLEEVRSVIAERLSKPIYSLHRPDVQAARERGKRAHSPTVKVRSKRSMRARSNQTRPDTELDIKSTPPSLRWWLVQSPWDSVMRWSGASPRKG